MAGPGVTPEDEIRFLRTVNSKFLPIVEWAQELKHRLESVSPSEALSLEDENQLRRLLAALEE